MGGWSNFLRLIDSISKNLRVFFRASRATIPFPSSKTRYSYVNRSEDESSVRIWTMASQYRVAPSKWQCMRTPE